MTAQEAIGLIPFWQKRLRLQDWDIEAVITDQREECGGGRVQMLAKYKAAKITILEPEKMDPTWLGSKDPEVTLVHELLHVQTEQLNHHLNKPKHGRLSDDMERVVELTAIALVTLRREAEHA